MKLQGKVAIVTGAAGGIGAACALALADEGASLVLTDVNTDGLTVVARALTDAGSRAITVPADIVDPAQVAQVVRQTLDVFGRIDILVNCAGIMRAGDILNTTVADFDRVIAVNLRAPFMLSQAVSQQMVTQGEGGAIVNVSSVNAVVAIASQLPYVTSKGGLRQLTAAMALGLAEHGIRVNAVGPGTIETEIAKSVVTSEDMQRALLSRTPMRRFGQPTEIAKVVVFLASDDSSYVTGQTIYADGGRLVLNYVVPV